MSTRSDETLRFHGEHKRNGKLVEVLYVESWATGWQKLLFKTHEAAKKWAEDRGAHYIGPRKAS